jgi:hypothetical protein
MKRFTTLGLLLALPLVAANLSTPLGAKPNVHGKAPAIEISGTVYGSFVADNPGGPAWVGYLLVSFGDEEAKAASLVDRNTGMTPNPDGTISGTETWFLTFLDGSGTFEIQARFLVTPADNPALAYLEEVGTITNGTGDYAGVSGRVRVRGSFLLPFTPVVQGPPQWISEVHGSIRGLDAS